MFSNKAFVTQHRVFGAVVVFGLFVMNAFAQAPTTQPSQNPSGIRTECKEWEKDAGREGECQVETSSTSWKVPYYREGIDKRSFKNQIKNLLVVFPPDASTHKIHEWWDSLVGPGKAIDTQKWQVLCLNYPVGDNSKMAASLFLTAEEILTVEQAVIEFLFPKRKNFVVSGASRGAQAALLFAARFPDDAKALSLVAFPAEMSDSEAANATTALRSLDEKEAVAGPYELWTPERRYEWWQQFVGGEVAIAQYTDAYFRNSKWMTDLGKTPDQYKNADAFKTETVKAWVEYLRDHEHPRSNYQRTLVFSEQTKSLESKALRDIPNEILLVANKVDRNYPAPKAELFSERLRKAGKKVTLRVIDDERGHSACCVPNMPEGTAEAIRKFLSDL